MAKPSPSSSRIDLDLNLAEVASAGPIPSAFIPPARMALAVSKELILLDPGSVIVPVTPNRSAEAFDNEVFDELRQSIVASGGNLEPILVHARPGEPPQYELVFGERRLQACRLAGLPVLCMVSEACSKVDDMLNRLRENLGRAALAPFDFAQQVQHLIDGPPPMTRSELASRIGVSIAQVSRAYDLSKLPDTVVRAFASPGDVRYQDVKPLRDAWTARPEAVTKEAQRIREEAEPLEAAKVVKRLVEAAKAKPVEDEFAPCKPQSPGKPQLLACAGQAIGHWALGPQGAIDLRIEAAMSVADREGLITQVLAFVERKVFKAARSRKSSEGSEPAAAPSPANTARVQASAEDAAR